MNYVSLVVANGTLLPVVEQNGRVRIFEDKQLAEQVAGVFSDQFLTAVVSYQKYLDALNQVIDVEQLFTNDE